MIAAASQPSRLDLPLAGFRCWVLRRSPAGCQRLDCVSWGAAWDPTGVNEAECLQPYCGPYYCPEKQRLLEGARNQAPGGPGCHCGLYSYSDLLLALSYVRTHVIEPAWEPGWRNPYVVGAVLLWGDGGRRVLAGEVDEPAIRPSGCRLRGLRYRSPFARVLALLDVEVPGDPAPEVGAALGLPVLPARGLELYASEFGRLVHLGER